MDQMTQIRRQRALAAGWSEDEIARAEYEDMARRKQATDQPQQQAGTTPVTTPEKKGFKATDLLPLAGGVIGGVAGSFAAPGVGTVIGGGAGSALGEALRQKIEGESDLGKVALEGGLGAIPVGKIAGLGLKGIGKVAGAAGENLVLRNLRPSKTQIATFAKETGENLDNFIVKNKLWEKGTQQVDDIIQPLQQQYDDLAKSTTTTIPTKNVIAGFKAKIAELKKIPNTQVKTLANQLNDEMKLVQKNFKGKDEIGIDQLTTLRRQIDQLVPDSKFAADPLVAGKNRHVREIYKGVIDEATGGQTAKIGKELSKLYAYRELAELQSNLGRGNLLVGMQPLIETAIGGTLGGGVTAAMGGKPQDTLQNTLIGMGFVHLANNPKVLSLASKSLQQVAKLGNIGKTPMDTTLPREIVGRAGMGAIDQYSSRKIAETFGMTPGTTPEESLIPQAEAATNVVPGPTPINTQVPGQESVSSDEEGKPYTRKQLELAAAWDIQNNGGKQLAQIKQAYDFFYPKGSEKQKSQTAANSENLATSGLQGLADAKTIFTKDPNIVLKGTVTGGLASRKFEAAMNRAIEGILRARSGAAVPESEVKKYRQIYGPQIGDSYEVALYKLSTLEQDLQGILTNNNVISDDTLPASPLDVSFPQ